MTNDVEQILVDELLDLDDLQTLQDGFAAITGLSVVLYRTDGKILTRMSLGNELCRRYQENDDRKAKCLRRITQAAENTANADPSSAITCFSGTEVFAVPITVEGRHLASLVVCSSLCSSFQGLPMGKIAEQTGLSVEDLKRILDKTPPLPAEQLQSAVTLLQSLATTLAKLSLKEYQLRQRLNELTILHNLTSLLAGRADLDEILRITAEQVVRVVEGKGCSIRIYNPDTKELQIRAVANLSAEYLRKGALKLAKSPIDQRALDGEPVYIENMLTDPRVIYKKEAQREGITSGLAVGMIYRAQAIGVIHIYRSEQRHYDRFEVECLKAIASQAASAIINARLFQEAIEAERMQRQLKLAAEVQRRMLPRKSPSIPNVEVGTVYEPSYLVGGDYYDFLELPDGRSAIVIADVAGKGIPASLQMASLKSMLRVFADQFSDLTTLVGMTNTVFKRDSLAGEFATLLLGVVDPKQVKFSYVNAGHYPAILIRDGHIDQLKVSGPALAIFDHPDFVADTLALKPSDKIILYTDGFIDAMNFDQQCFGLERLMASIRKYADLPAQKMADHIVWDVRRFIGLATQSDDMSLVVIHYNPTRSPQNP